MRAMKCIMRYIKNGIVENKKSGCSCRLLYSRVFRRSLIRNTYVVNYIIGKDSRGLIESGRSPGKRLSYL